MASPCLSFTVNYEALSDGSCKIGGEAITGPGSSFAIPEHPPVPETSFLVPLTFTALLTSALSLRVEAIGCLSELEGTEALPSPVNRRVSSRELLMTEPQGPVDPCSSIDCTRWWSLCDPVPPPQEPGESQSRLCEIALLPPWSPPFSPGAYVASVASSFSDSFFHCILQQFYTLSI